MEKSTYEDVLYEVDGSAAVITINREDRLNAFRGQTIEELIHAFKRAWADQEVRGVILTGAGTRAFCVGGDVKQRAETGDYGPTSNGLFEAIYLHRLNFRAALPGHGRQPLHADFGGPVPPGGYQVCNSIWLLDDFTADNGATRVVPGSHRFGRPAREALPDPAAAHPNEVQLIAPAGTVVVFNSHLWHGGTRNDSGRPRRALHSCFTRRANGQQLDQKKYIRPETLARLSPAARLILDV